MFLSAATTEKQATESTLIYSLNLVLRFTHFVHVLLHFRVMNVLSFTFAQRNFIRAIYKQVKGCHATVAKEFREKFNCQSPGVGVIAKIIETAEDEGYDDVTRCHDDVTRCHEEVTCDNENVIHDVFLPQNSSPRHGPCDTTCYTDSVGLHNVSSAFSFEDDKSSSLALQNLRTAARKSGSFYGRWVCSANVRIIKLFFISFDLF